MAKAFLSLLLIVAVSVGSEVIALADPSPPDSPQPTGPAVGIPDIFPTLPFQLGGIDTTAPGGFPTELAGGGPPRGDPPRSPPSSAGSLPPAGDDSPPSPPAPHPRTHAAANQPR